ncbi:MAG: glycosyltransferase [Burkholderiales bacterium]
MIEKDCAQQNVVQNLPCWLPLTATWLYNQVRYLPLSTNSWIVCESTDNLQQFPIGNIDSLRDHPRWAQLFDKGVRRLGLRRHLAHLVCAIKERDAAILHSHWGDVAWRALGAARKAQVRHIATFYGKDVNHLPQSDPRWRERYHELFMHVDMVLCEGPHMARCIVALGCPPNKVRVHRLGVEVASIPFRPRMWSGKDSLRVLIAASFREKKGIPYALEALATVQRELPGLEITIIGDASDDVRSHPEKAKILEVVEKRGLKTKTRMLGYQPHSVVFEEAYKHHIFISPSVTARDGDTEGGAPVTLIDMAATGMPILSTTHCDIPSVILHGRSGLLSEERDIGGLVEHMRWLVANPQRWQGLVEEGRRHVEAEFDAAKQSAKLGDVYAALSGRRSMPNPIVF